MRRPPRDTVLEQRIQDGEQLALAGDEGHLLGLAGCQQPLIELTNGRIETGSHQSTHVQSRPHPRSSAPHRPMSPRRVPESRFKGATPTKAARRFRSSVPSSGSSANSVLASTGPTPGTLLSKASFSRHARLPLIASSRSPSMRSSSLSSHRTCASMRFFTGSLVAVPRRFLSAVSMPTIWRLLASTSPKARTSLSGRGL